MKRWSEHILVQFWAKVSDHISLCHVISISSVSAVSLLPPRHKRASPMPGIYQTGADTYCKIDWIIIALKSNPLQRRAYASKCSRVCNIFVTAFELTATELICKYPVYSSCSISVSPHQCRKTDLVPHVCWHLMRHLLLLLTALGKCFYCT